MWRVGQCWAVHESWAEHLPSLPWVPAHLELFTYPPFCGRSVDLASAKDAEP